jgi:hypothetical protein
VQKSEALRLDEIKRIDSDATVNPHEHNAGVSGTPTTK